MINSVCTGDPSVTCTTNTDCSGPGGPCVGIDGECLLGPTGSFCDGVLRGNGAPFVACITNADCDSSDCGSGTGLGLGLCGDCTASVTRACYLDPVVAIGQADPETPVGVAAFCIGRTSNPAINGVTGLPGLGRVTNPTRAKAFCASNPTMPYEAGVGCPP